VDLIGAFPKGGSDGRIRKEITRQPAKLGDSQVKEGLPERLRRGKLLGALDGRRLKWGYSEKTGTVAFQDTCKPKFARYRCLKEARKTILR
jgi:hypothetical protein